jgi:histidinol-phosphate/aromatic aminotransferase/cobyric acid decarboxylase-like protein/imidazoleglycerol phosphate dehydratase HisB
MSPLEPLDAYQWPPSNAELAARVGRRAEEMIRFDGNVAPAPPVSARPAAVARALSQVNEYDRSRYAPLRERIAALHDLSVDRVALGAGSDEFIVLAAQVFAAGGTVATVPQFTYSMYRYAALMAGARMVDDPAEADLVYVCRPNNPTGEMVEIPSGLRGQVVIDEAYAQYAGVDETARIAEGAIILRTFSKAYGLAGARVGYALADERRTRILTSRQAPLSVSALSAALALAALDTPVDVSTQIEERERLARELDTLGLTPRPSATNFLFIDMDDPHTMVDRLLPYGVVTRSYPGGLRISVRDRLDNDVLLSALRHELTGEVGDSEWTRLTRATAETRLQVRLRAPGEGRVFIDTGEGFYDHMLHQLAFHGGLDLNLIGVGDLETGDHHTVEDTFRAFGEALSQALGDRRGITRYGEARVPMDEALAHAVVDLSGRAVWVIDISPDPGMATHALESLAQAARITIHVNATGENAHHVAEAAFKAMGRAIAAALKPSGSIIPSTKGSL